MAERHESDVRTEQPTPLRLEEARREGRVARSTELTSAIVILGALVALSLLGPRLLAALVNMTESLLDGGAAPLAGPQAATGMLWQSLVGVLSAAAGLLLAAVVLAVAAGVLQVGFLTAGAALQPNWTRLSPAANLRRVLSTRSVVRLAMAILKLTIVCAVAWAVLRSYWPRMVQAGGLEAAALASLAGEMVQQLALRLGLVLLGAGIIDYLYQRHQHREDLKMTRGEWLEDMRRMDGGRRMADIRRQACPQGRADAAEAASRVAFHGNSD